jgi:hypothetical protein
MASATHVVTDAIRMMRSRMVPGMMGMGMVVAVSAVMRSCRSRRSERHERQ